MGAVFHRGDERPRRLRRRAPPWYYSIMRPERGEECALLEQPDGARHRLRARTTAVRSSGESYREDAYDTAVGGIGSAPGKNQRRTQKRDVETEHAAPLDARVAASSAPVRSDARLRGRWRLGGRPRRSGCPQGGRRLDVLDDAPQAVRVGPRERRYRAAGGQGRRRGAAVALRGRWAGRNQRRRSRAGPAVCRPRTFAASSTGGRPAAPWSASSRSEQRSRARRRSSSRPRIPSGTRVRSRSIGS